MAFKIRFSYRLALAAFWLAGCVWAAPAGAAPPNGLSLAGAVRLALANNTAIKLAKQDVDISRGKLASARGSFDTVLKSSFSNKHTYTPLPLIDREAYLTNFETRNVTSFQVGAQKLLRGGVTLKPNVTVSRSNDTLDYPDLPASAASISFLVVVPLMRGLGEKAVAADERAAKLSLASARLDYFHSAAQNVYSAISDYWLLKKSQLTVEVYGDSESRAAELLRQTTALVKGEQQPKSVLTHLRANLELKTAQRLSAMSGLNQARESLCNTLGLDALGAAPQAVDGFPARAGSAALAANALAHYRKMALANRADLKSAGLKVNSAAESLTAALNQLKPKLDLSLSAGYSGLSEKESYDSFHQSFYDGVYGANAMVALHFEFPLAQNAARGQVLASRAGLQKAKLNLLDTQRRITLGVAAAHRDLVLAASQLAKAKAAVANYQKAVADERTKLKLATSTVVSVIQVEDQLTSALLNLAAARQALAAAVTRLRYETGTLLAGDPAKASVSISAMTTPPKTDGGR